MSSPDSAESANAERPRTCRVGPRVGRRVRFITIGPRVGVRVVPVIDAFQLTTGAELLGRLSLLAHVHNGAEGADYTKYANNDHGDDAAVRAAVVAVGGRAAARNVAFVRIGGGGGRGGRGLVSGGSGDAVYVGRALVVRGEGGAREHARGAGPHIPVVVATASAAKAGLASD